MTKPIDTSGLLPIKLKRLANGDVEGTLPDGKQVCWDRYRSSRPTRGYKRVMLNCYWWRAEWEN